MASNGWNASLPAATFVKLYTNSGSGPATMNIAFCNMSTAETNGVRVAISSASDANGITNADYIEYNQTVNSGNVYERTGMVISPGESIYVFDQYGVCSARVHGFEGN